MNIKQPTFIAKLFSQRERGNVQKLNDVLVSVGAPSYSAKIWDNNNSNNIDTLYKDIPQMKKDPIIGSALCFVMEQAFKPDSDNHIMGVDSPYKNVKESLDEFHREINLDVLVKKIGYNLLLWGNLPIKHVFDSESVLVGVRPIGNFFSVTPIVINNNNFGFFDEDGTYHYSYEYTYAQLDSYQDLGGPDSSNKSVQQGEDGTIVNEFTYAPSYLSGALKPWRNINIIQDALLLTRLDKSQYYRIISVDVGTNPTAKPAIALTNYYRNIFRKVRRISYDSNNMASSSLGNEFEVVLPTKGTNGIKVEDVGGQTEITALADLDQMVNSLFAALRISPSQIGYSEETPSSLGDSANKSWDSRAERLCNSLVYSVQQAIRHIDYVYLLSKGFEVNEDDWSYRTVSITHIEDLERSRALESTMESLGKFIQILRDSEVSYNKKYLIQSFSGSSLAAYGLSMDELFNNVEEKEEEEVNASIQKGKPSYRKLLEDKTVNSMIASGLIKSDKQPKDVNLQEPTEITYDQYLRNPYVNLDKPIRFSPEVAIAIRKPSMDKGRVVKNARIPAISGVFYDSSIIVTPVDIDESCIAPIHRIDVIGNKYYFSDKQDFTTYLSMIESGFNDLYVDEYILHKEFNYD